MPGLLDDVKRGNLALELYRVHSGLCMTSWTVEIMNDHLESFSDSERSRFVVHERIHVVLDLLAKKVAEVARSINPE